MNLSDLPGSQTQVLMASHVIANGKLLKARSGGVTRLLVFRPGDDGKLVGHRLRVENLTDEERDALHRA